MLQGNPLQEERKISILKDSCTRHGTRQKQVGNVSEGESGQAAVYGHLEDSLMDSLLFFVVNAAKEMNNFNPGEVYHP